MLCAWSCYVTLRWSNWAVVVLGGNPVLKKGPSAILRTEHCPEYSHEGGATPDVKISVMMK